MDEMDALLSECLHTAAGRRLSYRQAFARTLALDPFSAGRRTLINRAADLGLVAARDLDTDGLLEFLFTHSVQPHLGPGVYYIFDYPASQAALSRIQVGQPPLARRVEVFVDGLELANGYEELLDATEQRSRFEQDLAQRDAAALHQPALDEALLAALEHGLPDCAGIALGFDRLLMRVLKVDSIDQVLCFPMTHN